MLPRRIMSYRIVPIKWAKHHGQVTIPREESRRLGRRLASRGFERFVSDGSTALEIFRPGVSLMLPKQVSVRYAYKRLR